MKIEVKPAATLKLVLQRINDAVSDFLDNPAVTANDRGAYGDYPLHKVAIWGDVDAAAVLLDGGADIDAIGEDGDTPLHRAAGSGNLAMVRLLIERGANPQIRNRYGLRAIGARIKEES